MKNIYNIEIDLNLGKILGYLIFICGMIYAFTFKDSTVFVSASGIAGGLLGLHRYSEYQIQKKEIDSKDGSDNVDVPPE